MNCARCPVQAQIDRIRQRCLACNPESDAGTPHGRVRADDFTLDIARKARDFDRTPSTAVTHLKAEDEHRLRIAMSSLFGLDPVDLLLVQHIVKRGGLESFGGSMHTLARRIDRYHGSPRAMAFARKEKLVRKLPLLRSVITSAAEDDTASRVEGVLR